MGKNNSTFQQKQKVKHHFSYYFHVTKGLQLFQVTQAPRAVSSTKGALVGKLAC